MSDGIRKDRFEKLIKHLEWVNETCPESFSLQLWHNSVENGVVENYEAGKPLTCGFVGCVGGHMPLVFPEDFKWGIATVMLHTAECGYTDLNSSHMAEYLGGFSSEWSFVIQEYEYPQHTGERTPLSAVLVRMWNLYESLYGEKESEENHSEPQS